MGTLKNSWISISQLCSLDMGDTHTAFWGLAR